MVIPAGNTFRYGGFRDTFRFRYEGEQGWLHPLRNVCLGALRG